MPQYFTNPFLIAPEEGSTPLTGVLVAQLRAVRQYTLNAARDLGPAELDAQAPGCPNTIGMLLAHIDAAERMFQNITVHRVQFTPQEEMSRKAFRFEANPLAGNGFDAYREALLARHEESRRLLADKEDSWLGTPATFAGNPSNYHYYWTHLLLDEARHTGQIILMRKHLIEGSEADFNPYLT